MQTLTKIIVDQGVANRVLSHSMLEHLVNGSDQRRYSLVNRALKSGELLSIKRGVYVLADKFRNAPVHPYAIAQALAPGSYISAETSLAYHQWIPERVYLTTSIVPGRKSSNLDDDKFGSYSFKPLAIQKGYFLELVERLEFNGQVALVAKPVRALADLICLNKTEWQGLNWLSDSYRINSEHLLSITSGDIRTLKSVYIHKGMQVFLSELAKELNHD